MDETVTSDRVISSPPPPWIFAVCLRLALFALLGFAVVGLPLAMIGWFRPWLVFPLAVPVVVVLAKCWGRHPRRGGGLDGWTVGVVAVVGVVTALNVWYAAEHLWIDRDPGVYTVSARLLADDGALLYEPDRAAFDDEETLDYASAGWYRGAPGGRYYPQFLHLLPATMAAGYWVGGSFLLFAANALLGGVALLAVYGCARYLVRPSLAALATTALAVSLPQVFVSRDAYSEVLTQIFVFGGLFLLAAAFRDPSPARFFVAGLTLGATVMTRIDALLYLAGGAAVMSMLLWGVVARDRAVARRQAGTFAAGVVLTAGIGLADGLLMSRPYLDALGQQVRLMAIAVVISTASGIVGVLVVRHWPQLKGMVQRHAPRAATVVMVAILVGAAYAWFVRPHVEEDRRAYRGTPQQIAQLEAAGQPVPETERTYAEDTMVWLNWYLGPVALALGMIGLAFAVRRLPRRRNLLLFGLLALFLPIAALYLERAHIGPNHVWAMRRFVPIVIPGLLVLGAWALDRWLDGASRFRRVRAGVAIVIAGATLATPMLLLAPVWRFREQRGMEVATIEFCRRLGPDGAAVFTPGAGLHYAVTVAAWCDAPAARAPEGADRRYYEDLARRVEGRGRHLVVFSGDADPFGEERALPGAEPWLDVVTSRLEITVTSPPDSYRSDRYLLYGTPLPAP